MGIRFRKSITLVPGIKLNLGKSGISASFGKKGFRYTVNSKGKSYVSTSIPGTGISYRTELSSAVASKPASAPVAPSRFIIPPLVDKKDHCRWCGKKRGMFEHFTNNSFCIPCSKKLHEAIDNGKLLIQAAIASCESNTSYESNDLKRRNIKDALEIISDLELLRPRVPFFKSSLSEAKSKLEQCSTEMDATVSVMESEIDQYLHDPELSRLLVVFLQAKSLKTSQIQQILRCGYLKAAQSMDSLYNLGVLSEFSSDSIRTILFSYEELLDFLQAKNSKQSDLNPEAVEQAQLSKDINESEPVLMQTVSVNQPFIRTPLTKETNKLIVPRHMGYALLAYHYDSVEVHGTAYANPDLTKVHLGDLVTVSQEPTNAIDPKAVKLTCNDIFLGYVPDNKLKEMCNDWFKRQRPILSLITGMNFAENQPFVFLGFYKNPLENMAKMSHFEADLVKTSKKDYMESYRYENALSLSIGDLLQITDNAEDIDEELEKRSYIVTTVDGDEIGELNKKDWQRLDDYDVTEAFGTLKEVTTTDSGRYKIKIDVYYD